MTARLVGTFSACLMLAGCCTTDQADGDALMSFSAAYDTTSGTHLFAWSILDLDAFAFTNPLGVLDGAGQLSVVDHYDGYQGIIRSSGNGLHLLTSAGTGGPEVSLAVTIVGGDGHVVARDAMLVPPDPMDFFQTKIRAAAGPDGFLVLSTRRTSATAYDLTLTRLGPGGAVQGTASVASGAAHSVQVSPIPYAIARADGGDAWIGYQDGTAVRARQVAPDGTLGAPVEIVDGAMLFGMAAADDRILVFARRTPDPDPYAAALAFIEPTGAITTVPGNPSIPAFEGLPEVLAFPGAGYLVGPYYRRTWLDLDGAVVGSYTPGEVECSESSGTVVPAPGGTGTFLVCDDSPDGDDIVSVLDARPIALGAAPAASGRALLEARRTPTDPDDLCPSEN